MSYIGSKPADAVLETDDIADGVVTSEKIADGTITTADLSFTPVSNPFRNIIINGDMSIAQRGTSVSGITGAGYNTIDRFRFSLSSAGTWTQSQSTDVPSGQGFAYSLKMDCTTANASLSAGSSMMFNQRVEGQNVQYLKKGTSNAESLTLSFWVKSNKTGTYIIEIFDRDNTRQISKSYTISSADTWEKKIITFEGDTTGAFNNDNGLSLDLLMWLVAGTDFTSGTLQTSWGTAVNTNRAVGQVNLADNTANYINITGVQLEAGTTASDFEFLPYDVNLGRCQRYYQFFTNTNLSDGIYFKSPYVSSAPNSSAAVSFFFKNSMRANPSMSGVISSGSLNRFTANTEVAVAQIGTTSSATAYSINSYEANAEL